MKFFLFFFSLSLFAASNPIQWGENTSGVSYGFETNKKEIALTMDACGGSDKSSQYDSKLINYLIEHKIQATLFINARWIDSNPDIFKTLANNPLFEIANHGTAHKPLSVNGKSIYNISGTSSPEEVAQEIEGNNQKILKLTGKRPLFFRSGTAYYDEEAVKIAMQHGMEIGGFAIVGDAGATLKAEEVQKRITHAHPGDIVIIHMNHPESGTREGLIRSIEILQSEGYNFVKLSDVKNRLKKFH